MKNEVFTYNGSPITFQTGESTMINATEMAKPFGKVPKDWLRTSPSKEFINSLSAVRHICPSQLVIVNKGNSTSFQQGTWLHEDVALEFARWLSPAFAIWCNDRIKELFKHGITATPQTIDNILADPDNAIRILTELKQEREALAAATKQIETLEIQRNTYHSENRRLLKLKDRQDKVIQEQAPLVEYAQNVLDTYDTFTTTQIAKELDMTAHALNKFLHDARVIYKQGGQWFLYAKYQSKGYVKTKETIYEKKDGRSGCVLSTVWTAAGRMFVRRLVRFKNSLTKEAE